MKRITESNLPQRGKENYLNYFIKSFNVLISFTLALIVGVQILICLNAITIRWVLGGIVIAFSAIIECQTASQTFRVAS